MVKNSSPGPNGRSLKQRDIAEFVGDQHAA
jgi:hypothetical protein